MQLNNFSWKIGGEAGYGIKSIGTLFAKAMMRLGLQVFTYDEYPSLIRGGHNAFEISANGSPVYAPRRPISILMALDQKTLDIHQHELAADSALVYDSQIVNLPPSLSKTVQRYDVPMEAIVNQSGGEKVMRNTVAFGASFALLDIQADFLKQMIERGFGSKDQAVTVKNVKVALEGYDYVKKNYTNGFAYLVKPLSNPGRLLMTGNEALAWGAIKAGCRFYAGYPMTPSTSILQTFADHTDKYHIVFKQTEDEISAICAAIGASYAGVRAMTATSGGGFSLMVEALGMAAMTETPLVVVEAMRPGPSTGLPTWSGQGDLKFVLNASQDEFPRVVMAPGDVGQCFSLIQHAFNLSEKYQLPVVVLTDKHLAECYQTAEHQELTAVPVERGLVLNEEQLAKGAEYKRYAITPDGISARVLPGTKGGEHLTNSDEHDEKGFSDESAEVRVNMVDKRFRKLAALAKEIPEPVLEGDHHADLTIVSWGSTRGVILESIKQLRQQGVKINYLQIKYLHPFPVQMVMSSFHKAKKIAVVENNKTGQLAAWIKEQTGLDPHYKILKYDGRPFFTDELISTLKEIL